MSVLLITHDLGVVAEQAERVIVMYAGKVVESASAKELFARPRHPYTRGLLESIPRPGSRRLSVKGSSPARPAERLHTIEGMVPDLRKLPTGCRFADRCPMVMPACREEEPEILPVDGEGRLSRCIRAEEV